TWLCLAVLAFGSAFGLWVEPARAQGPDPFAEPPAILTARGAAAHANVRFSYDMTRTTEGAARQEGRGTFDVATDWVLVRNGAQVWLYDYKLGRDFKFNEAAHTFVSFNPLGNVVLRVMERQNRGYLAEVLRRAGGASAGLADDCDAESELGV